MSISSLAQRSSELRATRPTCPRLRGSGAIHCVGACWAESEATKGSDESMTSFIEQHDFEARKAEAQRIRDKYPDRIPVICEKSPKSDIPDIDRKKYLVPCDLNVGQFVYVIRKRIKLQPEKGIFIFVNDVLPSTAALMSKIYEEQVNADGFLYVTYSGENTFGSDESELISF